MSLPTRFVPLHVFSARCAVLLAANITNIAVVELPRTNVTYIHSPVNNRELTLELRAESRSRC